MPVTAEELSCFSRGSDGAPRYKTNSLAVTQMKRIRAQEQRMRTQTDMSKYQCLKTSNDVGHRIRGFVFIKHKKPKYFHLH